MFALQARFLSPLTETDFNQIKTKTTELAIVDLRQHPRWCVFYAFRLNIRRKHLRHHKNCPTQTRSKIAVHRISARQTGTTSRMSSGILLLSGLLLSASSSETPKEVGGSASSFWNRRTPQSCFFPYIDVIECTKCRTSVSACATWTTWLQHIGCHSCFC
jgi:hypothetical protein